MDALNISLPMLPISDLKASKKKISLNLDIREVFMCKKLRVDLGKFLWF